MIASATAGLQPGFADPVADSQACFRAVLAAMSRPGLVQTLPHLAAAMEVPAPLHAATAAVVLTLVDQETPVWLDAAAGAAHPWIAFHTGAAIAARDRAAFAIALSLPDLDDLPAGTDEAPETAATVILQVAAFGRGQPLVLQGPGLRTPQPWSVDGLPDGFPTLWQRNHARFPRGIDLILCAGNQLAALPRSVGITARPCAGTTKPGSIKEH